MRSHRLAPLALPPLLALAACGAEAAEGRPSTTATVTAAATTTGAPEATAASTAAVTATPATVPATTPSSAATAVAMADSPAGSRVVAHAIGDTEVPAVPERVVVLDSSFLDASIALGVTPVGATAGLSAGQLPPYLDAFVEGGLDTIGDAGMTDNPNLEAVAALEPDLILCAKVRHAALYEQLAAIAPTVCSESSGTNWTEQVLLTAEALGKAAEADQLLADFATRAEEVGAAIGADGMTARIVRFLPGETRVYGEPTFSGSVLTAVGFDVMGEAPLEWHPEYGMALVSPEQFELLDADVIFATGPADGSARPDFEAVWGSLAAVAEGHLFAIDDGTWMTGIGVLGANLMLDDLESWLAG